MNDILNFFIKNPEIYKKFIETYNSSKSIVPEFHSEDFDFIVIDVLKQTYENVLKNIQNQGLLFTDPFGVIFFFVKLY